MTFTLCLFFVRSDGISLTDSLFTVRQEVVINTFQTGKNNLSFTQPDKCSTKKTGSTQATGISG
ncbi:hypothetical protein HA49_00455 [Tatumella morbirosei]|uniref:Uncharacterized protein n=1 Tax=Tatumella morbirosei TaxID=642227 RepID=A0A095V0Z6_9GAMM|nr:hypothetical protein HA49_00455 [Tatumella morbirosei]